MNKFFIGVAVGALAYKLWDDSKKIMLHIPNPPSDKPVNVLTDAVNMYTRLSCASNTPPSLGMALIKRNTVV